jgi:ABC-type Fe3+-hydroxamate transport system substrate-binding protein
MIGHAQTARRRRVRTGAAMAAILTAAAVTTAACSANTSTPSTASPTTPAPPAHPARDHALRGSISAENSGSWTVTTAKGVAYTVNISPTTTFGTKKAPATEQSFPVGNNVVVMGKRTGTTIDATRIAAARSATPAPPNLSTSPTPTG